MVLFPRVGAVAIAAILGAVVATSAQSPTLVTVQGRVINAVTGEPVAGADVSLNFTNASGAKRTAVSGDDGRYFVDNVPAGGYYLFAIKAGFFCAGLNDDSQPGASDLLTVGWPGPQPLTLKLRPHSTITGVILNEADAPVAGARIILLSKETTGYGWGRRWAWRPVIDHGKATTDTKGHYVIEPVTEGDYLVQVDAGVAGVGPEPQTYGTTYFPSALSIRDASAFHLQMGETRATDVRLRSRPAFDLGGVATAPESRSVFIQLFASDESDDERRAVAEQWTHEGPFLFRNLPAGDYVLVANINDDFWAEQRIAVAGRSLTEIQLRLAPMLVISGRTVWEGVERPPERATLMFKGGMLFEGGPQRSPDEIERIRAAMPIGLASLRFVGPTRGDSVFGYSSAVWTSETTFNMKLPPGRYVVDGHSTNGWLIKSFRIDGREMTEAPVEVFSGSSNAVLTLTKSPGQVELTTVTAAGKPAGSCGFAFFSTNRRVWPGIARFSRRNGVLGYSDETGRSSVEQILPGEYYLAAVSAEALDDVDEEMLATLAGSAIKVSVPPVVPLSLTLTCAR